MSETSKRCNFLTHTGIDQFLIEVFELKLTKDNK